MFGNIAGESEYVLGESLGGCCAGSEAAQGHRSHGAHVQRRVEPVDGCTADCVPGLKP